MTTKERIEKDAKRYLLQTYGENYPDIEKAYIAGATAERNKTIDDCMGIIISEHNSGDITAHTLIKRIKLLKL